MLTVTIFVLTIVDLFRHASASPEGSRIMSTTSHSDIAVPAIADDEDRDSTFDLAALHFLLPRTTRRIRHADRADYRSRRLRMDCTSSPDIERFRLDEAPS